LPVLTSTHFSPNHLPRPALGFRFAATFCRPFHAIVGARPLPATTFVFLRRPRVSVGRGVHIKFFPRLGLYARPKRGVFRFWRSHISSIYPKLALSLFCRLFSYRMP
jgi:hypothetical protein